MTMRERATKFAPVAIVLLANVIAAIGLHHAGMEAGRIAVLIAFLVTFTWLLSESLELVFRRRAANRAKAWATGIFAAFLAGVEIWVHHHGAIWLFGNETPALFQYAIAAGFVFATITAKWLYMSADPVPETKAEAPAPSPAFTIEGIDFSTAPRVPSADVIHLDRRDFASSREAVSAILEAYRGTA